jgi:hypothetical protein
MAFDYAVTDLKIANQALNLLGESKQVTQVDGTDTSALGVLVGNLYQATRDEELKAWGWIFAIKRASLTAGAAPTNGYAKRWNLTGIIDCLRVLDVYVVLASSTQYGSYTLAQTQRLGFIFDASAAPTGVIYTMIDAAALTVYLKYIAEVTTPANYDMLFAEAVTIRLAAKMSIYLTQNLDWKKQMEDEYSFIINRAKSMNVIEELDNDLGNPWFGDRRPWDPAFENRVKIPKTFMQTLVQMAPQQGGNP